MCFLVFSSRKNGRKKSYVIVELQRNVSLVQGLVPKRSPLMVKRSRYETREDVSAGMDWDAVGRLYNLGLLWNKMACILQILPTHDDVNALLWHLPQPRGKQVPRGIEGAWNWSCHSFPQIYLRFGIIVCFLSYLFQFLIHQIDSALLKKLCWHLIVHHLSSANTFNWFIYIIFITHFLFCNHNH